MNPHIQKPQKNVFYKVFMVYYDDGNIDVLRVSYKEAKVRAIVEYDELNRKGVIVHRYPNKSNSNTCST